MSIMASNGSERASQLLALTERLHERIYAEAQALEAHRPQDMREGIEETRTLANLYRFETTRIQKDPGLLDGISEAQKNALREATVKFQALLKRHAQAVDAAKSVTEGLISAIAQEAQKQTQFASPYGPGARAYQAPTQSLNLGHRA